MTAIEDRLRAWGQWSRRRGNIYGECDSFEGNFRSPQHWEQSIPASEPYIDADDCKQIELAWSTLGGQDKVILRSHYCRRHAIGYTLAQASAVAGIKLLQRDWYDLLDQAHTAISAALRRGDRNLTLRQVVA